MNPSTQYSQEIVMQELTKLSETQKEEVLSFIHSLMQDSQNVLSPGSAQIQQPLNEPQSDESLILIALKQFPEHKQQRLNFLAEKNTEGTITKEEFSELEELVDEAQVLMFQNTETLVRVIRPDLFDKKGRLIRRFLTQAVRAKASHKTRARKDKRWKESIS